MRFEEVKESLIAAAERAGLKEYEIYYQMSESISAETLKEEISAFSSGVAGGVCFRCIVNGKMGYASGELLTPDAMEELVRSAISNAACIDSEDEVFIFAGSKEYAKTTAKEPRLMEAAEIRALALDLQKATYEASPYVTDGTQSVALSVCEETYLCNSHGLELSNRVGMSGGYAAPICRKGDEAQEHFEFSEGTSLQDMKEIPEKAVKGALDKMGAGTVPTGRYSVVFDGRTFRSFLAAFSSAFSAKSAQMGLSKLAGREGQQIAAPCVTVIDDPMREGAPMQTSFDGEGVATERRAVVEKGVLKTLLYDLTTAKKAGVASTGNGQKGGYSSPVSIAPYNFGIAAGEATSEELFEKVGEGLYITECKGFHAGANAVTGDFSIESAGFMIRDGKRAEPVKSFTVAGNFYEFMGTIEALGDTVKWGIPSGMTVFGSPDVLARDVSVAGK